MTDESTGRTKTDGSCTCTNCGETFEEYTHDDDTGYIACIHCGENPIDGFDRDELMEDESPQQDRGVLNRIKSLFS